MEHAKKNKAQLIEELKALRKRVTELEKRNAGQRHVAEALPESEEGFRLIFEEGPIGMYLLSPSFHFIKVNNAFCAMLGYPARELIGRSLTDVIHAEDAKTGLELARKMRDGEIPNYQIERRYVKKTGETIWTNIKASIIRDSSGNVLYDLGIVENITESRRAELALGESETKYRRLVESLNEGVWVIDQDANTSFVNHRMAELLGYTVDEMLGRHLFTFMDERSIKLCKRGIKEQHEFELLTKDGQRISTLMETSPITDSEGNYVGAIAGVVDITERKRAEEEIHARVQQQAAVADLGQRALVGTDIGTLLDEAASQLTKTLNLEYCKILEILPGGGELMLRAGFGWKEGYVGQTRVSAGKNSQAGYTLLANQPVIVENLATESRFRKPILLLEHGVVSGMSVIIAGKERPFGVLGVATTHRRTFSKDDIYFLQAIANVLAEAMQRLEAEKALKMAQFCIDHAADPVFWVKSDASFVYVNDAACNHLEYTRKELLSMKVYDVDSNYPKKDWKKAWNQFRRWGATTVESTNRAKNGKAYQVEVSVNSLEFGSEGYLFAFVRDITERKKSEKALRASEEKFRTLVETVDAAIFIYQEGQNVYVNRSSEKITGYSQEELLRMSFWDVLHPDFRSLVKARGFKRLQNKKVPSRYEVKILTKSGETRWLDFAAKQIEYEGKPAVLGVASDITERKQAEEALHESEQKYRSLTDDVLDSSTGAIIILDVNFRVVWVNQMLQQFFGLRREEIVGKDNRQLLHNRIKDIFEDPATFCKRVLATYDNNTCMEQFECHVLADGKREERWLEHRSLPIQTGLYAGGRIEHYYDITERKRAEQALQKTSDQLRALAAHLQSVREEERTAIAREMHDELGQVLTALRIDVSLMGREVRQEQAKINAAKLSNELDAMQALIDGTIKKLRVLITELRPEVLDSLGLIPALEWQAQEFKNRTGIDLEFKSDIDKIVLKKQPAIAIFRIFQEALTNIARHARATRSEVRISKSDGHLLVEISDNGIGIPKQRLENSNTFGLLGMRERAWILGGAVEIRRKKSRGTTVKVRIPI
ncbi:MAG: PAS domain S-box protein [bacterium]